MGRSEWSYELSETVNANPEAVMAWWFDSDRAEDFLRFAEKIGAIETSFSETIEDGVRVRTTSGGIVEVGHTATEMKCISTGPEWRARRTIISRRPVATS